jgi:translation initiation factor 1
MPFLCHQVLIIESKLIFALMAKQKNRVDVVYSTNPNFQYQTHDDQEKETLPPAAQTLYISLDKKARAGKKVSLIEGFIGSSTDLELLGKQIKNLCGSGGSSKDGEILIQGDHRDKIEQFLKTKGYNTKRKGG